MNNYKYFVIFLAKTKLIRGESLFNTGHKGHSSLNNFTLMCSNLEMSDFKMTPSTLA